MKLRAFRSALLAAALVCASPMAQAQQLRTYALLLNATGTGKTIAAEGGNYNVPMSGTFGGTTLTLSYVLGGQTVTLGTWTSAPATPPCYSIPQGAAVTMAVSGGSPTGLNASIGGVGTCPATSSITASLSVAPLTSGNLSGTIAVTNTFQSIQVSTAGRNGCTIVNPSTSDLMWVYFGAIGTATKAKSFIIGGGSPLPGISCAVGGLGVLTDQVSITGTGTDPFTANFQ